MGGVRNNDPRFCRNAGPREQCLGTLAGKRMFRVRTLVYAISIALLVYLTLVAMIARRVARLCPVTIGMRGRSPTLIGDNTLNILGVSIPLAVVWTALGAVVLAAFLDEIFSRIQCRNRERLGLCLECGHELPRKYGKCPGCGVRYERIAVPARRRLH